MPSSLRTCLMFDKGEARKAATFYAALFPNSHVGPVMDAPADFPGGKQQDELTVAFTLLGSPFLAINGGPDFKPTGATSFIVETADQAETDRYWDALTADGGVELPCGWCKDPWGFSWQITPRQLAEALGDPDKAAAKRVFQAMLTMRKIDIAAIERARQGT